MYVESAPLNRNNPQTIAGKLKMRREHPKTKFQAFLVVEGWTDLKVFNTYVDDDCCYVAVGYGKPNVLEIMDYLQKMKVDGALFVVDADFDPLLSKLLSSDGLIYTDTHDLETMILRSPALIRLLDHYRVSAEKRHLLPELLFQAAKPLGSLRFLNERFNLGLNFNALTPSDFDAFYDASTLKLNVSSMVQSVVNRSMRDLNAYDLEIRLNNALRSTTEDPWILCCGHDMVEFLAIILTKWCGHGIYRRVTEDLSSLENIPFSESLEDRLYLAWESVFFFGTKVHEEIEKWEHNHTPMKVIKRWS